MLIVIDQLDEIARPLYDRLKALPVKGYPQRVMNDKLLPDLEARD